MPFPEISDYDFSAKGHENEKTREALDYAEKQHAAKKQMRERLQKLYDAYNGIMDEKEHEAVTTATGKKSKTKYVKYRLGRSKMKQLHGEFLEINFTPTIRAINPEANNRRMDKYKKALGMAIAKPYIENIRQMGYEVFNGYNPPDLEDDKFWSMKNFKLANDIVMQDIVLDKVQNEDMKIKLHFNFIDLTIASMMFGKIERDANGIDTLRFIPAKDGLFEEEVFDPFLERTPYKGEVRKMYLHEILANPEIDLTKQQKEDLKKEAQGYATNHSESSEGQKTNSGGHPAFDVYTIQWKGLEEVIEKISPAKGSKIPYKMILKKEFYEKNKKKIDRDVKAGKYEINFYYQEILWSASKIGKTTYTKAKKDDDLIQILKDNGKYKVESDYVGCLFNTVDGQRVSLQEIIFELERIYDDIRFQINRELKKLRGSAIQYDKAFLPIGKKITDVIHSLSEDGILEYNSSAEGNRSGMDAQSDKVGIKAINLGENSSMNILLAQAIDIERVMDKITGMNESRQGLAKATSTATGNMNNIEASRSMTYDLFYFMNAYAEKMLTLLAEKTKLNRTLYGKDSRKFLQDENEIAYLMSTADLMQDSYGAKVTDGKKEKDILQKLEMTFQQEVNAGIISSSDIAKFLTESNFTRALKVLDTARARYEEIQKREGQQAQEMQNQKIQSDMQMHQEDREDQQAHDQDMERLRTQGKKEVELVKAGVDGIKQTQKESHEKQLNVANSIK